LGSISGSSSGSNTKTHRYELLPCHSISLTRPQVPYAFTFSDHGTTRNILPDILGDYEVHLFLRPTKAGRRPTLCVLSGNEDSELTRWEQLVESVVLPPQEKTVSR
jgi:hypothetical protein